jgi:uncharacterized membrane protein
MVQVRGLRSAHFLVALEGYAFAELLALTMLGTRSESYVATGHAPRSIRLFLVVAPIVTAALTGVGAALVVPRLPRGAEELVRWVKRCRPILFLWPLPALLARGLFSKNELFLMLLASAMVLGLEWSLSTEVARVVARRRQLPAWLGRRWVPAATAVVLTVCMFAFACDRSLRLHEKMLTSNFDLGLFENLFWNALHGRQGIALERPYFGEHAEFLLYALLPIYALAPRPETLLVLQSAFIVGAAVPLYLFSRRLLQNDWHAVLLTAMYLAFPTVNGCLFYDFHFLPLSVFFVFAMAAFYVKRNRVGFWLAAFFAASCREDVALGLAAVGFALWMLGRTKRLALALGILGSVWFAVVKFVWMRQYGDQSFSDYYTDLIAPGTHGFEGIVQTLVTNPIYALSRTLTEDKLLLALHLLVPLAFAPLRLKKTLVLLLPGLLVVGLVTNGPAITRFQFHYSMHFVPYLFIAAVVALALRKRAKRPALLAAMALGSLISAVQFDAFGERVRASFENVSFSWTKRDTRRLRDFDALAALVPADASVSAGEYEGPHLARRLHLMSLKDGLGTMDYALYSLRSLRWGGDESLLPALRDGTFGVVATRGDITLLKRGADTSKNARAIARLEPRR